MNSDQPEAGGDDPGLPLPTTDGTDDHPVLGELDDSAQGSAGGSGDAGDGSGMPDEPLPLAQDSGPELKTFRDLLLPFGSSSPGGGDSTVSGGYRFSPDELRHIKEQWEDIRDSLRDDRSAAQNLGLVEGPGSEFASGDFAEKARTSGEAYYQQHMDMIEYVKHYIEKLEEAEKAFVEAEDQAGADIGQAGGQKT